VSDLRPIPTPLRQHARRIRYQLVPVLFFGVAVLLAGWLWKRHISTPNVTGEVEVVQVDITSPVDGRLIGIPKPPWQLLDPVAADDLLARLDPNAVLAGLDALRSDLSKLAVDVEAARAALAEAQRDRQARFAVDKERMEADLANLAADLVRAATDLANAEVDLVDRSVEVERARLGVLDRKTQQQVDRAELDRREELCKIMRDLFAKGIESQFMLTTTELPRDIVKSRIEEGKHALKQAEDDFSTATVRQEQARARRDLAKQRKNDAETGLAESRPRKDKAKDTMDQAERKAEMELETRLKPLQVAVEAQAFRIRQLEIQVEYLSLRSPIVGTIAAINKRPGQNVRIGDVIMTVAATGGQHVISYIRQNQRIQPSIGMPVEVRVRSTPMTVVQAIVDRVGARYELVPPHQLWDTKLPEWGLPVRISIPKDIRLRPGELVDVTFRPVQ